MDICQLKKWLINGIFLPGGYAYYVKLGVLMVLLNWGGSGQSQKMLRDLLISVLPLENTRIGERKTNNNKIFLLKMKNITQNVKCGQICL